ncbi:MAG: hypothetical protein II984_05430 [Clostridia bacterium]|nr:hypothetical protein [Clostridia bacterium]
MKNQGKIILTVFAALSFLCVIFWKGVYYVGGLSHLYYSKDVLNSVYYYIAISIFAIAIFTTLVILMFKSKGTLKIICISLLIVIMLASMVISFFEMLVVSLLGSNGCSYTENIDNYGKYDGYEVSYFPKTITDDMTVIKFSYYYKYVDIDQVDIYLEVKFKDKETMDLYLSEATSKLNDGNVIKYQSPYNSKYTDIISNRSVRYGSEGDLASYIKFDGDDDYKYVEMGYNSISYSYDELVIIYNYTFIGSDIMVGNNPDKGEYYPKYLERFGVEWNPNNDFMYKYIKE